jgi:hypothetical protein
VAQTLGKEIVVNHDPQGGEGDPAAPQRQRLLLHIGFPKTGTTYLQSVLAQHRAALSQRGFVYPYSAAGGMFKAAVEMTGSEERRGFTRTQVEGSFDELLDAGREHGGTVVISHEIFGGAHPEHIEEIGRRVEDFEVHVVLTVRDLARVLPAAWQERVKNGSRFSFDWYADHILSRLPDEDGDAPPFWRAQNLADALERWSALVPPERLHVVVCPAPGAPSEELWNRFSAAIGLPDGVVDLDSVSRRNDSLGTAQIAFMREVNKALDGRMPRRWQSRLAKHWFAQDLLGRVRSGKPISPPELVEQLNGPTREWIELVEAGRFQVHGDLADLLSQQGPDAPHPDEAPAEAQLEGLAEAVADLLVDAHQQRVAKAQQHERMQQRIGRLRKRVERLETRLAAAESELESAGLPLPRRVARKARAAARGTLGQDR